MNPGDLLLRPGLWPLLLLGPLAWWALRTLDRGRARRLAAAAGPRAGAPAAGADPRRRALGTGLFAAGLLLGAAALLEPAFGEGPGAPEARGADVVLCLDVSRSMEARDEGRSRLARAKEEIRALAEGARGDRLALVLFAGEARLACPLTGDGPGLAALAEAAGPEAVGRGGTDLGAAVEAALAALRPGEGAHAAVVLLTDGEDLEGRGLRAAGLAAARGVALHAVGFGSPRGAKIPLAGGGGNGFRRDRAGRAVVTALDAGGLRAVAAAGGGVFLEAGEGDRPLLEVYHKMILPAARAGIAEGERRRRTPRFPWPLSAALLLWTVEPWIARPRRS